MKIYHQRFFNKYIGHPIRIKSGCNYYTAIADGFLLATFNSLDELRKYFPYGNYKKIN